MYINFEGDAVEIQGSSLFHAIDHTITFEPSQLVEQWKKNNGLHLSSFTNFDAKEPKLAGTIGVLIDPNHQGVKVHQIACRDLGSSGAKNDILGQTLPHKATADQKHEIIKRLYKKQIASAYAPGVVVEVKSSKELKGPELGLIESKTNGKWNVKLEDGRKINVDLEDEAYEMESKITTSIHEDYRDSDKFRKKCVQYHNRGTLIQRLNENETRVKFEIDGCKTYSEIIVSAPLQAIKTVVITKQECTASVPRELQEKRGDRFAQLCSAVRSELGDEVECLIQVDNPGSLIQD